MPPTTGLQAVSLTFAAGRLPAGELRLLGVRGVERISTLSAFDLYLARDKGPFSEKELDGLFAAPCAAALGEQKGDVVRGVLESVRILDPSRAGAAYYVARMVPTLGLLGLARTNRVFQNLTVPEIVASVLAGYQLRPERDFRFVTRARAPKREFVVQYEETDWAFVQRLLEHDGIASWFEHAGSTDLFVISDGSHGAPPIAGPTGIRYRARSTLDAGDEATVSDWEVVQTRPPARVALHDYNYRTPHVRLAARADVHKGGFGTVMEYGDHFKNIDEGAALAQVRAEEIACRRRVVSGATDCSRFRVGHWFTLEDARDPADEGKYLITEVDTEVGEMPDEEPRRLTSRFRAIGFDVPFRPARVTPRPRIHGVMNGHVAGDGQGQFAEVDELGRYKVRLPFDSANTKGLGVSRWIRMAQPHTGPGYGSHQPLHKGVEVLVAFVDGDPDRPIIVGSVPNAHTVSPSTAANATQSVTRTASGIHIELEDLATASTTAAGGRR